MDLRETILSRLALVCGGISSGVTVFRNRTQVSEDQRPCISVLDGDEECDTSDANRHALSPRRVLMRPEIYILVGEDTDTIGTTLNGLRAAVIRAILEDATLENSSLNDTGIQYEGSSLIVEEGRTTEGAMQLEFSLRYLLRPELL